MKKNFKIILIIILAGILAYLLFLRPESEVSSKSLSEFAIKDTASIDRIFLADNDGNQSLLTRQPDGTWMVNNKWRAKDYNVYLLLRGFYNLEVKSVVPNQAVPTILKQIAAKPIKVEVYMKGKKKPEKIYYFGYATQDHYGNYALLEIPGEGKSKVPYIVKEAGFYGFIRPRLITNEKEWRYNGIFQYGRDDIAEIKVRYPKSPFNSFTIERKNRKEISLYDADGKKADDFNPSKVREYIKLYRGIYIETFNNYLTESQQDSVLATTPKAIISVTDHKGKTVKATVFDKGFVDPYLREEKFNNLDPERYYVLTDDNQLVIAQRLQWDPLLIPLNDFLGE